MKKRLVVLTLLFLSFMLPLATIAFAENGTIKLTLVNKTDTTGWSEKKVCNHYYFIGKNGVEVIPKTFFPNNETTVIELPKTKENYTIRFGYDGVFSTGQPNPFEMVTGIEKTFPGNKSLKLTFDCSMRGAAHGLWDLNSSSFISGLLNNKAGGTAGETAVPVAAAIVIGLAGGRQRQPGLRLEQEPRQGEQRQAAAVKKREKKRAAAPIKWSSSRTLATK